MLSSILLNKNLVSCFSWKVKICKGLSTEFQVNPHFKQKGWHVRFNYLFKREKEGYLVQLILNQTKSFQRFNVVNYTIIGRPIKINFWSLKAPFQPWVLKCNMISSILSSKCILIVHPRCTSSLYVLNVCPQCTSSMNVLTERPQYTSSMYVLNVRP